MDILLKKWTAPYVPSNLTHGDMPGDKICIEDTHIHKASILFPEIKNQLYALLSANKKIVLSVYGGSGVGKSEIASVLAFYLTQLGIGTYIMSGDNYPHRIPKENDAERLRVYRTSGLRSLVSYDAYNNANKKTLQHLWSQGIDADSSLCQQYPWLSIYQRAGACELSLYLGTPNEINFSEVNNIITNFKKGEAIIALKRMGRESTELWYDYVDFSNTQVLLIEWTHGNSDFLQGVDFPIFLNSTPAETLAHRRARNRDGQTDSAFTTLVLSIEQTKLDMQARHAKIILSKNGELLSYQNYLNMMAVK